MELLIYVPRVEASMRVLRSTLLTVIKRYKSLALPLPREFCRLAVLNPSSAIELLMGFGNSFIRLWGWVPNFLREVMVVEPGAVIDCYDSIDRLRRSADFGVEVARLVIRYRVSGRVDYGEWLGLFRSAIGNAPQTLPGQPVVVVDDYVQFMDNANRFSSAVLLGPLVPTPMDIIALISMGRLGVDYLARAVDYVVNYLGNYVVMSRDLTEALSRLVNDREYVGFVRSMGLPVMA